MGDARLRHRLRGDDPGVGASGAIAGVLGGYLMLFPRARILSWVFPVFFFPVRAWLYLGVWFLFQLVDGGYAFTHPVRGAASRTSPHVGGFAFGFLAAQAVHGRPAPEARAGGGVTNFEAHVAARSRSCPHDLRRAMSNVEIVVEDENDEDPDLFGLYTGIPLDERDSGYAGALPDKIEIYRLPLEEEFGDDPERARGGDPRHRPPRARPITSASTRIASTSSGWS